MLKLSKTITARAFKGESWGTETRTIISVNYDPHTHEVEIESIVTESQRIHKSGNVITTTPLFNTIDVTDMFLENFPSLESDIMAMDWESEYKAMVVESPMRRSDTFNQIANIVRAHTLATYGIDVMKGGVV